MAEDLMLTADSTALYRLFGWADDFLCAGISKDPEHRFRQHAYLKYWWPEVDMAKTTTTWYPTWDEADEAETAAIHQERPRYNSAKRPPSFTDGRCDGTVAKYLQLDRKEVLAWPDHLTDLTVLARILNRGHGGAGERITTNTLIRVAMALLLDRADELVGGTEVELRRSLGLD